MNFIIKKPNESILTIMRKLGYRPHFNTGEEFNCVRSISGGAYPRFHLYIKESKEKNELSLSLHLDQKKPSYEGSRAHGGEYTGEVVEKESDRIKSILSELY